MIEHIEIEGFKSLHKVSLDLGPLNIFVGTNASGKSNFLEALRVLQGIGYGYTVDEIFNGKPRGSNHEVWDGIRGGSKFAATIGSNGEIRFKVRASLAEGVETYESTISATDLSISGNLGPDAIMFWRHFTDLQALRPNPSILRLYSKMSAAARMGDEGENFAALIRSILLNKERAAAYLGWLKELTPAEVDWLGSVPGAAGDWLFALRKNGIDYPAPVLSDGTLRFAAIAAAFFQPSLPHTLILEEIEEGLHPTRLRLLIELLQSQAGKGIQQIFATSHSPYAISWLKEEDYRYVFLCSKNEETGATSITPFSKIPRLMELARTQPIADLFAEGWLESAV